jgi:uncharacterized protein (TIGR03067 family)
MRCRLLLTIWVGCCAFAAARADDYDKLAGTWRLTAAEIGGKKVDAAKLAGKQLVVKDGKMQTPGEDDAVSFKLDPAQDPKAIDIYSGRDTIPGIYALNGDELKLCYERGGKSRPTKFASRAGTRLVVYVFKRQPKEKKEKE